MEARRLVVEGAAAVKLPLANVTPFELSERLDERREEVTDADLEFDGDLVDDASVTYSLTGSRLDLFKSELG